MSFINSQTLADQLDLPISLTRTSLEPNDGIVVSVFELSEAAQRLTFKAVQLHGIVRDPAGNDTPTKVDAAKGAIYFGIFKDDDTTPVLGSTIILGATNFDPPETLELAADLVINGPTTGTERYTMKVINNTTNLRIESTLTGTVRINLNTA